MTKNYRAPVALWIALIVAIPLAGIFLLSLVAATAIGGVIAVAYFLLRPSAGSSLPRRSDVRRSAPRSEGIEIEIDPRDYRRIPNDRNGE